MRNPIIAALATLALLLASPSIAHAEKAYSLQEQIDEILLTHPGGTQAGPRTVTWEDGTIVLRLVSDRIAPLSVGSCATGYYCAYNGLNLSGSSLSFSTCSTTVSLAALPGIVRSLANARSTGYIQGLNSSGTSLTTVYAGNQVSSAPAGITQLKCVS